MDFTLSNKGWFPAAARFGEAIGHVSNYPLAYVYGIFLALSGHIIGRQAYIRYATPLYPNSYICLVGASGLAHKSTAMNLGLEALGDTVEEMPPIRSLTTSQGLLQAMMNGGGMAMVVLDELASMTSKLRQDFAADLLSRIVELYGCPRVAGNYTRYDPIEVQHTFLTIISGSTVEWLRSALTANDLMAGFGNRMTFILGDPRADNPWPKMPYLEDMGWNTLKEFNGQVRLDENARDVWDDYYERFIETQKRATPFVRVLSERIPEKILKACIVMAAWSQTSYVDDTMLERAIEWGRYLRVSVEKLTPAFENVERQVLAAIKDGYNSRQKLFGSLSHSFATKRIREACENLRWLGYIAEQDGIFIVNEKKARRGLDK